VLGAEIIEAGEDEYLWIVMEQINFGKTIFPFHICVCNEATLLNKNLWWHTNSWRGNNAITIVYHMGPSIGAFFYFRPVQAVSRSLVRKQAIQPTGKPITDHEENRYKAIAKNLLSDIYTPLASTCG